VHYYRTEHFRIIQRTPGKLHVGTRAALSVLANIFMINRKPHPLCDLLQCVSADAGTGVFERNVTVMSYAQDQRIGLAQSDKDQRNQQQTTHRSRDFSHPDNYSYGILE